jgi:hypothetical protein
VVSQLARLALILLHRHFRAFLLEQISESHRFCLSLQLLIPTSSLFFFDVLLLSSDFSLNFIDKHVGRPFSRFSTLATSKTSW